MSRPAAACHCAAKRALQKFLSKFHVIELEQRRCAEAQRRQQVVQPPLHALRCGLHLLRLPAPTQPLPCPAHSSPVPHSCCSDGAAIQEYLGELTGGRSVPRVFVGGKFIGGGDDTDVSSDSGSAAAAS